MATYAKESGVQVHITAATRRANRRGARGGGRERARAVLGDAVFGTGDTTLSAALGLLLESRGLTVATWNRPRVVEAASAITDTNGSSQYFLGGVVAYTREAKAAMASTHALWKPTD